MNTFLLVELALSLEADELVAWLRSFWWACSLLLQAVLAFSHNGWAFWIFAKVLGQ